VIVHVSFDLPVLTRADRRRYRRLTTFLEGWGIRLQRSVFELRCSRKSYARLRNKLGNLIVPNKDALMLTRIRHSESFGRTKQRRELVMKITSFDEPWVI
jgi:CRISPR-associated endonuclease Cas2